VPLEIGIEVCVHPHYLRSQVRANLLEALGNGRLANGTLGLFHPDAMTFGGAVYVSAIVAAAKAVEGVEAVRVKVLKRLWAPDEGAVQQGVLTLGAMEVGQLDNDPTYPENGKLTLTVSGGR
jgi:hypothetical protein